MVANETLSTRTRVFQKRSLSICSGLLVFQGTLKILA